MNKKPTSTAEWVSQAMLDRIQSGEWPVGSLVPGERVLMEQFGVSRIALREALSMLRALGVIETDHGRGSTVQRIDAATLGRLVPLMLSLEGEQTFEQIFEVRLALESRTAYLAAQRRSEDEMRRLDELVEVFRRQVGGALEESIVTDLEFHLEIARATHNPLFPLVLSAISSFVTYVQTLSCKNNPVRRQRALEAHESIAEAIRDQDAERARVEMEVHLRYSALRILKSSVLSPPPASEPAPVPDRIADRPRKQL
jgi:GntR family transcriptional repressor for pyruvate dehydrogenase complex